MRFRNLRIGRKKRRYGGKYSSDPEVNDANMYRCRICGFPCDKDKVAYRKKLTEKEPSKWTNGETHPVDSDGDYYCEVTKYCPFCGSPDWK